MRPQGVPPLPRQCPRGGVGRSRNAAELMTLTGALHGAGIQLELLTGPMTGIYDPAWIGSMLCAVCAVAAQLDRDYIRDKTLEGQQAAAPRGNHGGRPKVIDHDTLLSVRAGREACTPMPKIARTVTINTGKNAGSHPSAASLYRALAEAATITYVALWSVREVPRS